MQPPHPPEQPLSPPNPNPDLDNARALYDPLYPILFSATPMAELLLRSCVPGFDSHNWNFQTLTLETPKLQGQDLKKRRGDLLLSIRRTEPSPSLCLFIPLEFQSSSDPVMAFRFLEYSGMLYQKLYRSGPFKEGAFPEILCLTLYNGREPWTAPQDIESYLFQEATLYRPDTPHLHCHVIDIHRYPDDVLEAMENPVGWLMLMEKYGSHAEKVQELASRVDTWSHNPDRRPIRMVFVKFLYELIRQGQLKGLNWEKTGLIAESEVVEMGLAAGIQHMMVSSYARGEERGERRGEERGEQQGLREAVQAVLEVKFQKDGTQFWENFLASAEAQPAEWKRILQCVKEAETLHDLSDLKNFTRCPPETPAC